MTKFRNIESLGALAGKRVLLRADLNVPMKLDDDGNRVVTDDTRIKSVTPTIMALAEAGARVLVLSHFGRPKGERVPEMSLEPLGQPLANATRLPVSYIDDCIGDEVGEVIDAMEDGAVLLLENVRFYKQETDNDADFAEALAANADFYVNDAFSCCHRAHASTEGIAKILPSAAGLALEKELNALEGALGSPVHPVAALVGGAKVSTKLDVLTNLVEKVDHLIIGGGMANTFLAAQGVDVGASLCEHDLADTAKNILANADKAGCKIHLPSDVVLAKEFAANAENRTSGTDDVASDEMILDVGAASAANVAEALETCKTLIWNGPMGAFEIEPFDAATVTVAKAAGSLTENGTLVSVAGGGDTVAALNHAGVAEQFSHISTAGGAFLEWMEGKELPGVQVLLA
ncbi:phosphoglycerate kinase [Pseudemcibacter aquimaris]|uniref:phosphoglycerate kinase n=1 Tax=Pseudemcibacter aquimaris TaxID=2857064 RepID=UPI0020114203|nr:phosphoglycerate kinase [Pseudemcibacter aquimaris]MCC3862172.1 phosphoglycerate kinase [Pseudemcibacter aquimaris]WDU58925.1 phosphoglycerate kinase [Pseudemcibacter aquimaris]